MTETGRLRLSLLIKKAISPGTVPNMICPPVPIFTLESGLESLKPKRIDTCQLITV